MFICLVNPLKSLAVEESIDPPECKDFLPPVPELLDPEVAEA